MKNISTAFRNELNNDNRRYVKSCTVTLADGTVLSIDDSKIWNNGFKVEDAVSGTSSFDIGSAIINKFTLTLNNIYDDFSDYDFTDAVVANVKAGLKLPDGTVESVRFGVFTVDETRYNGSIITLECLDNMAKFDKPYSLSTLVYPARRSEIIVDACRCCGVTYDAASIAFGAEDFEIPERPDDTKTTFREVVSCVAQMGAQWARCDMYGRLAFGWYDIQTYEAMDEVDGGYFDGNSPYSSGDSVDGGTFYPWNTGDSIEAGDFTFMSKYHHIFSTNGLSVCTDDVVITGVRVSVDIDGKKVSSMYGTEGYLISMENNILITTAGMAGTVAGNVGRKVTGLRFRPFTTSCLDNPAVEAGDVCYITDRKQNTYKSFITNSTFQPGNYQQLSCNAETPARKQASRYSAAAKAVVQARKEAEQKLSAYDIAVQQMNQLAANTFGFFHTVVQQEDGSVIAYRHDKPKLAESKVVYKSAIDGFFVTQDYRGTDAATSAAGKWKAGFDSNGNAVLNMLSVVGINFSWAKGGILTLGGPGNGNGRMRILDEYGRQIGYWDNTGIHATQAVFEGALNAGTVGGWTIKDRVLSASYTFTDGNGHEETRTAQVNANTAEFITRADSNVVEAGAMEYARMYENIMEANHFTAGLGGITSYGDMKLYNLTHVESGGYLVFDTDGATLAYLPPGLTCSFNVSTPDGTGMKFLQFTNGLLTKCSDI